MIVEIEEYLPYSKKNEHTHTLLKNITSLKLLQTCSLYLFNSFKHLTTQ